MPSPFPGMNPYFEQVEAWHGFHERFITYCADFLVERVRPNYFVKQDEHIYIHDLAENERTLAGRADVWGAERPAANVPAGVATAAAAAAATRAPAYAMLPPVADVERDSFIEIRDRLSRELVTVIELLSPANKRVGPDREQYLAKRRQVLKSPAHLVEIDLLRGWARMPLEALPQCDYCVAVSRADERPRVGVWPIRLRDPLLTIPVPLRGADADVQLDLAQLIHRIHDAGGFAAYMYDSPPEPPLRPEEAAWAAALAHAAKL